LNNIRFLAVLNKIEIEDLISAKKPTLKKQNDKVITDFFVLNLKCLN